MLQTLYLILIIAFSLKTEESLNCTETSTPKAFSVSELLQILDSFSLSISQLALSGRISANDRRYFTFEAAMNMMVKRNAKVLIETGTSRYGDRGCEPEGCSSLVIGHFARIMDIKLTSVDISEENCNASRKAVEQFGKHVEVVQSDSLIFLHNFPDMIDFLYLDSYDFDWGNPSPSQMHHLKEIQLAYPKLHKNSIVMIDDCGLIHGGKCKLVDEFLKDQGWTEYKAGYAKVYLYQN